MAKKFRKACARALTTAVAALMLCGAASPSASAAGRLLVPMGCAVGIELSTDGVVVAGTASVKTTSGEASPAADAGISAGDVIIACNGAQIHSGDELKTAFSGLDGSPVTLTLTRDGASRTVSVAPAVNSEGGYELGLRLRDGMAGIGTITFYDPQTGVFGALGHAVNDVDSGIVLPLRNGTIMRSVITGVNEGVSGTPGQLIGSFSQDNVVGSLYDNGVCGIFGEMDSCDLTGAHCALPIADKNEVETGPAVILSNVSGESVSEFDVEITRLFGGGSRDTRSMMIRVTDPELLDATGGIVQGMSGSPIIQNGKLIGAVTHVLVNDPTRGYGISIEDMLEAAAVENRAA